jgi:hypothetical protein
MRTLYPLMPGTAGRVKGQTVRESRVPGLDENSSVRAEPDDCRARQRAANAVIERPPCGVSRVSGKSSLRRHEKQRFCVHA